VDLVVLVAVEVVDLVVNVPVAVLLDQARPAVKVAMAVQAAVMN